MSKDELASAEIFQTTYEKYKLEMEAKFEEMMNTLKGEDDNDDDGGLLTKNPKPNGPKPTHDGPSSSGRTTASGSQSGNTQLSAGPSST